MSMLKLPIALLMLLNISQVLADTTQVTEMQFLKRIEAVIGANEVNRIQVDNAEIMEVVGDESKYSIHWSGDYRHLFLVPKINAGELIDLSLVLAGGKAQDMRFTVGDVTAQTIALKAKDCEPGLTKSAAKEEITRMLRAMINDVKDKYYARDITRIVILKSKEELQIKQTKLYRYKDLSGAVLKVTNTGNQSIKLNEENFANIFRSTVAVSIEDELLLPKGECIVRIITKGAGNEQ